RHRGGSADADQVVGPETLAETPHQQCDIGTLAAAIGVEFVEYEESQTGTMLDDESIDFLVTSQDQLQHHEVRQKNIRRVLSDATPLRVALLTGVTSHGNRRLGCSHIRQVFVDLF